MPEKIHIDINTLQELHSLVGEELMFSLIEIGKRDIIIFISIMATAISEEDYTTLAQKAHDLKSIFGNLGAASAQQISENILTACRTQKTQEAIDLFYELEDTSIHVVQFLDNQLRLR